MSVRTFALNLSSLGLISFCDLLHPIVASAALPGLFSDDDIEQSFALYQSPVYATLNRTSTGRLLVFVHAKHPHQTIRGESIGMSGGGEILIYLRSSRTGEEGPVVRIIPHHSPSFSGYLVEMRDQSISVLTFELDGNDVSYILKPLLGSDGNHLYLPSVWNDDYVDHSDLKLFPKRVRGSNRDPGTTLEEALSYTLDARYSCQGLLLSNTDTTQGVDAEILQQGKPIWRIR